MANNDGNVEIRRLLIVRTNFSSAFARDSTKKIDDLTEEVTLRFGKDVRDAINKVRNKYLHEIHKPALNFYGLRVIREKDAEQIYRTAQEANSEMQEIESSLGATIQMIPLYLDQKEKGEVYGQVLNAIQARIYGELLERLRDIAKLKNVPKASRTALLKLCDRLHQWNVVDDPSVTQTLADIKLQIENDVFEPVMADLKKELDALADRGAALEFD